MGKWELEIYYAVGVHVEQDWVEDMIMMGSIIMGKADRNDQ